MPCEGPRDDPEELGRGVGADITNEVDEAFTRLLLLFKGRSDRPEKEVDFPNWSSLRNWLITTAAPRLPRAGEGLAASGPGRKPRGRRGKGARPLDVADPGDPRRDPSDSRLGGTTFRAVLAELREQLAGVAEAPRRWHKAWLNGLAPANRRLVTLKLGGLTHGEIADRLGREGFQAGKSQPFNDESVRRRWQRLEPASLGLQLDPDDASPPPAVNAEDAAAERERSRRLEYHGPVAALVTRIAGRLDVRQMMILSGQLTHRTPDEIADSLRDLGIEPPEDFPRAFAREFRDVIWRKVEALLIEQFSWGELARSSTRSLVGRQPS